MNKFKRAIVIAVLIAAVSMPVSLSADGPITIQGWRDQEYWPWPAFPPPPPPPPECNSWCWILKYLP